MPFMSAMSSSSSCVLGALWSSACHSCSRGSLCFAGVSMYLSALLAAQLRGLRIAPRDRRLHAVPAEYLVERLRLGRVARFDQHVELEGLLERGPHTGHIIAAIDRLLRERDRNPVVACDPPR